MEAELLSENGFLKALFDLREKFCFQQPVTISQISFARKNAVENDVIMIGDSAGMVAPLFGNGMSMALRSSALLFPLLKKFLERKISRAEMLREYARAHAQQFSARLSFGRWLQPLMVIPALTNSTIAALNYFPAATRKIISITHGEKFSRSLQ